MATSQLKIARRFVEDDELPRSGDVVRYERRSCRDSLCPGFAAMIDTDESSLQPAKKKGSTVRNEVSNASSFLARFQAIGRTDPADVTGDDVIRALTDGKGRPTNWLPNCKWEHGRDNDLSCDIFEKKRSELINIREA